MKQYVLTITIFALGCGAEPLSAVGVSVDTPVLAPQDRSLLVTAILTNYASAVLRGDGDAVLAQLSSERLARVELAGGIGAVMREQSEQIRLALGDKPDFGGLTIVGIESFESDRVIAATFSLNARPLPKPVYFVLEGGKYRLNLRPPQARTMPAPSPRGGADQALLEKRGVVLANYNVSYLTRNDSGETLLYKLRTTSGSGFSPEYELTTNSYRYDSVYADNCTNIFLDGTEFQGKFGFFWQIPVMCAYQWANKDFYIPSSGSLWMCTQTCT